MAEYLCQVCRGSPWSLLILLVLEVLMVGTIVFWVTNHFFHEDHQARIQGMLNDKRLNRLERIMRERGELDSRAPWD